MAERPVVFEGRNLALVGLNAFLIVATVLLWFGPGASELDRERAEVAELQRRADEWERRVAASPPLTPGDLERWTNDYSQLSTHGFEHGNDSVLVGRLANWLATPGLTRLDITPLRTQQSGDDEEGSSDEILVSDTEGKGTKALQQVRMRARFRSNYRAFSQLLARLSDPRSPVEVQHLEASRNYPNIKVDLQLALWTHAEKSE